MVIESAKNRLLKDIRRLRRCKGDRALLEGPHLISEAIAAGLELEMVLATPEMMARLDPHVRDLLPSRTVEVRAQALDSVADSDSPRGLVAVAQLPRRGVEVLPEKRDGVYLYLDGLQDPGNLGAVARAAEASAVTGIALSPGCVHPNHPRALRGSAGSLLRLPTAVGVTVEALVHHLHEIAPDWVALTARGEVVLYEAELRAPIVLALGGERGLGPEVESHCGRQLRIPMAGPVESLNAAVAAALVLFEIRRARS
jgi:TrmH family RNA methyltransferase